MSGIHEFRIIGRGWPGKLGHDASTALAHLASTSAAVLSASARRAVRANLDQVRLGVAGLLEPEPLGVALFQELDPL